MLRKFSDRGLTPAERVAPESIAWPFGDRTMRFER